MGLAALRQTAELAQVELARRMGVTQAAISRMETKAPLRRGEPCARLPQLSPRPLCWFVRTAIVIP